MLKKVFPGLVARTGDERLALPVGLALVCGALVALPVLGVWLVLAAARRQARYPQALAALFGTGTILNLALLPVALLVAVGGASFELAGALAGSVVMGWGLAVLAHILRHALEIAWGLALALGALYLFVSIVAQRAHGSA